MYDWFIVIGRNNDCECKLVRDNSRWNIELSEFYLGTDKAKVASLVKPPT